MSQTTSALYELRRAVEAPCPPGMNTGSWRWTVRQRMAQVRDLLTFETSPDVDGWLAARDGALRRERLALLTRLAVLGPRVLEEEELDDVRDLLRRIVQDIDHHLQRVSDLAYDEVGMEIGGSE